MMVEFRMEDPSLKACHLIVKATLTHPVPQLFDLLERFLETVYLPFELLNLQKPMVVGLLLVAPC